MGRKSKRIDALIVNSPYEEPGRHWFYDRDTRLFELRDGRRPAGYVVASPGSRAIDDPGIFIPLPLVNQIRPRVRAWREAGYPNTTGITRALLQHWRDPEERKDRRFFFCQLEAMETLIWLTEADPAERQGIDIPSDGGDFPRLCAKMATGSGKTIVMAMLISWQVLNKTTYPQDPRFARNVLVIAPGLTVKSRLQVLQPSGEGNYFDEFNVVPDGLRDRLRQGRVVIHNYHRLIWETEEQIGKRRSVDKRGARSDEAYVRDVLGEMASARNLLVINDEAHHAWRVSGEVRGVARDQVEEATKWVGGLDRIHSARGILTAYDFTATPFVPTGRHAGDETLFAWIASDFGLNDAIESGLVKTPRIVVRDDSTLGADYKSRLYHIYNDPEVKDDLNRKAEAHVPLPDLVTQAYFLLGKDWLETLKAWEGKGAHVPPVMITVANRTETAARIKHSFDRQRIRIDELCDPERTLHIDSKVLEKAEAQEEAAAVAGSDDDAGADAEAPDEAPALRLTKDQQAEVLRRTVDTVGRPGMPGEQIRSVISVGMLSEGWDARTVTHIMGLRAFTSQLLCEQVVGRGLRRTVYDVNPKTGLFEPEYVNIFGVPFSFLPHEGGIDTGGGDPPPAPDEVFAVHGKREFEIRWPNVTRIDHVYKPSLRVDWGEVQPLTLDSHDAPTRAALAAVLDGHPDLAHLSQIDLQDLGRRFRLQRILFEAARDVYEQVQPTWAGNREFLLGQVIRIVEDFLASDKIRIVPASVAADPLRRRILLVLNINKLVQHIWEAIRFQNTGGLEIQFDREHPIRSTGDMQRWFTRRPNAAALRSHMNVCVFDSGWEANEAAALDDNPNVAAWVKNDHLGFEVIYVYQGVVRKYRPDFLIRLTVGKMLVLEVKGQDTQQDRTKRRFLDEWVAAVNEHGGFGAWAADVSLHPHDVAAILQKHNV